MSEDLRTEHIKLESPFILTKNSFFAQPLGQACPPCLRQWLYDIITAVDCCGN